MKRGDNIKKLQKAEELIEMMKKRIFNSIKNIRKRRQLLF